MVILSMSQVPFHFHYGACVARRVLDLIIDVIPCHTRHMPLKEPVEMFCGVFSSLYYGTFYPTENCTVSCLQAVMYHKNNPSARKNKVNEYNTLSLLV